MRFVFPIFFLMLLAACVSKTSDAVPVEEFQKEEVQQETGNVSYRGIVEPLGISLHMQGTHRLKREDDRFVLLEGPAVDLNEYLGEEVEVFGAARPTVEVGGVIMRVERISRTTVRSEESSIIVAVSSALSSSALSPAPRLPDGQGQAGSSLAASVVGSAVPRTEPVLPATTSSSAGASRSSFTGSLEQDARMAMMAKEKFSKEQWTQEYCSPHVGFCFPVHRNWWFKSFGATASSLWHVEVNSEPVENLGDGLLLVNLVQGGIATAGAVDSEVRMHGNFAVGYRSFSENRHFEISAPIDLKDAVSYMTENLK